MSPGDEPNTLPLTVRVPRWLKPHLVAEATRRGISVNGLICVLLVEAVGDRAALGEANGVGKES